jgi:hypothetical protein
MMPLRTTERMAHQNPSRYAYPGPFLLRAPNVMRFAMPTPVFNSQQNVESRVARRHDCIGRKEREKKKKKKKKKAGQSEDLFICCKTDPPL